MKKFMLLLFLCSPIFGFTQTNVEQDSLINKSSDSENCDVDSCWGNGTFDASKCACECNEGFTGKECDQLEFSNGNSLQFDTYVIDFAELVSPENIVLKKGVKYIKKNSTRLEHTIMVKNITDRKIAFNGRAKSGMGVLYFNKGREISPNSEIPVKVKYISNRPLERLEWITFKDGTEEYKVMVKLRITD